MIPFLTGLGVRRPLAGFHPLGAFPRSLATKARLHPRQPPVAAWAGAQRRTARGGYFVSRCKAALRGLSKMKKAGACAGPQEPWPRRKIAANRRCGRAWPGLGTQPNRGEKAVVGAHHADLKGSRKGTNRDTGGVIETTERTTKIRHLTKFFSGT